MKSVEGSVERCKRLSSLRGAWTFKLEPNVFRTDPLAEHASPRIGYASTINNPFQLKGSGIPSVPL